MAYIRKRGNQLALVHGERDPETRKVCQRVLFTFYSKKEAVAALDDTHGGLLQSLLELEYPEIRFPWKRIWWELARNLDALPEDYEYPEAEMVKRFRADLCAFTRQTPAAISLRARVSDRADPLAPEALRYGAG